MMVFGDMDYKHVQMMVDVSMYSRALVCLSANLFVSLLTTLLKILETDFVNIFRIFYLFFNSERPW